jgi:hypothetical protein
MAYLVLQVDRSVEVRNLGVDRLADHLTLARVHHGTQLYQNISEMNQSLSISEK